MAPEKCRHIHLGQVVQRFKGRVYSDYAYMIASQGRVDNAVEAVGNTSGCVDITCVRQKGKEVVFDGETHFPSIILLVLHISV